MAKGVLPHFYIQNEAYGKRGKRGIKNISLKKQFLTIQATKMPVCRLILEHMAIWQTLYRVPYTLPHGIGANKRMII